MSASEFEFEYMRSLLRLPADDPKVVKLIRRPISQIERNAYYGSVEYMACGVSIVFKEAPWVVSVATGSDPTKLHLCAFHLHREKHEGYSEYSGRLPEGVGFGDTEAELFRKLGHPSITGGGTWSTMFKRVTPRWHRYALDDTMLQFQLDSNNAVELVSLYVPDLVTKF